MEKNKILLVDDEPEILEFLEYNLLKEEFDVYKASNGLEAISEAKKTIPDLILMDVMMPGMDGIEACAEIKATPGLENTLIVMLSARSEDFTQIAGFKNGADDYITKPIRPKLLIAKLNAILGRNKEELNKESGNLKIGTLDIDTERRIVKRDGEEIMLAKKQFQLLLLFASKPGKIFTRDEIYSKIWGDDLIVGDRTLDVHIRKLREKVGEHLIRTSKGTGYGVEI